MKPMNRFKRLWCQFLSWTGIRYFPTWKLYTPKQAREATKFTDEVIYMIKLSDMDPSMSDITRRALTRLRFKELDRRDKEQKQFKNKFKS